MELSAFFKLHPKAALAYSGGVDSTFLLYAARMYGCDVRPFIVCSRFQPKFETAVALEQAMEFGAEVIDVDVLSIDEIAKNTAERCYLCKKAMFASVAKRAASAGCTCIMDGTNASDAFENRPGMRALSELGVLSPLKECGITKADVRRMARDMGLACWDAPSDSCLATRIPHGTAITAELLEKTERAEDFLRSLGLSGFRVRYVSSSALIQAAEGQEGLVLEHRGEILSELSRYYNSVMLDLEVRCNE